MTVILNLRLPGTMKARLQAEAAARQVNTADLVRAGLHQFLEDLEQRQLGYTSPRVVVVQLTREPVVELRIPRQERGE